MVKTGHRKPAPVVVKRVDPSTGELLSEETRSPKSFGRHLPPRPTKPDPDAWRNFWGAHSECLTREERQKIAKGRSNASLRPLEHRPAWEKGDVLEVAAHLDAEVEKLSWSRDGYVTIFRLIDHRPLFMARAMGGSGKPWVDDHGFPVPYSAGVKEDARIDGAYTRSASQGMTDAGDVLDEKVLGHIHADSLIGSDRKRRQNRIHVDLGRAERRLEEAKAKHWATGHIERQIEKLKARQKREAA